VARHLSDRRRVLAVDLRNHGGSPHTPDMSYPAMAADIRALMDDLGLTRAAVMGHSMGGKVAMRLALETPERISRLVVVDIAPVTYPHDFTTILAGMRALNLEGLERRSAGDALLEPLIPDPAVRQFLLRSLVATGEGFRWHLNLDAIGRSLAALAGFPTDAAGPYPGDALFVSGALSPYVTPEHLQAVLRYFPEAEFRVLASAGHWVHVEQPRAFLDAVQPFLDPSVA
jgi:esterase